MGKSENELQAEEKPASRRRLPSHDYSSPGAYFVTICARRRQPFFEIPELAAILQRQWEDLPHRFPTIKLDQFVIMPDHLHFILWLQPDAKERPTLSTIVQAYKSLSAHEWQNHALAHRLEEKIDIWQRSFYDSIIRDDLSLETIRFYIQNNPLEADKLRGKDLS